MSIRAHLAIGAGMALAAASFLTAAPAFAAADLGKEIATAETHAGYAIAAADMKMMQTHLHHVVNCMVGPKGKGFDETQANPCKDMGGGVMVDAKGTGKAKRASLQQALNAARAGAATTDMALAKKKAGEADAALKKVM